MNRLLSLSDAVGAQVSKADPILPLLARFVFAATLLMYFWVSGVTKLGDGIFGFAQVTAGGFGQIFPKAAEAVLWDVTQMTGFQKLVVLAGTWAEFILPLMIVIGFLTRLAALGMIGFVVVQSLTDIVAHGAASGAWFDKASDSLILDQRAFWVLLLVVLVVKGAGALSVDQMLRSRASRALAAA